MYAMDHTQHFEHRAEAPRPRWDLRRSSVPRSASAPTAARVASSPLDTSVDQDSSPTHAFLD